MLSSSVNRGPRPELRSVSPPGPRLGVARLAVLVAIGCVQLFGAGCAARSLERSGGERELELEPVSAERARVTIEVKAALLREPEIDSAAIQVGLDGERVVLEGFVASEQEAERAVALAREAAPEREIVNELAVP